MINYQGLYQQLSIQGAESWAQTLPEQIKLAFRQSKHGDLAKWQHCINQLPAFTSNVRALNQDTVRIGQASDITEHQQEQLAATLMQLHPWRKGPYDIFGININTEWRSDWKWQRLQSHIAPLQNRFVLDVGCGNGYHCWRMAGAGAKMVLGIDPTLLSVMQFHAIKHFYGTADVYVLPLGIEAMPQDLKAFDTVFSMGVLYHRRSPLDHIMELRDSLRPGGELVLETLVIEGEAGQTLLPETRYAKMRNVWFIPSSATLIAWMQRCGLKNVRLVDKTPTSIEEQRSTDWMHFHSLADFLDPDNPQLTIEGLPAPIRAIFIAEAA